MNVQVFRTNASSYQRPEFFTEEQKRLESIPGVSYIKSLTQFEQHKPFILITNTHTSVEQIASQILNRTILMIHPNSGYDNFPPEFVRKAPFPIILGNQIRASAVSEYILSAIFREFCQIPSHHHWAIDRSWDRPLLKRQKVLLIGFGHIGQVVYQALTPLVNSISVFDPYANQGNVPLIREWDDHLMEDVGIVICACSLNEHNRNFFDLAKLRHLPADALLVNAARGELFNEEDLIQVANKNPKMRFYLDVFSKEPFDPGHMHHLPNVNKTSHIAGVSRFLNQMIIDFEYQVIKDFLLSQQSDQGQSFKQQYQLSLLANRLTDHFLY